MSNSTRRFYERDADIYDAGRFTSDVGKLIDSLQRDMVLDLCSFEFGDVILDIGTGTGRFLFELANQGAMVIGLDSAIPMINQARKKIENDEIRLRTNFIIAAAQNPPIRNDSLQWCITINVLSHIEEYHEVIMEVSKILGNNCHFLANFPNLLGVYFLVAILVRLSKRAMFQDVYSQWFTFGEILKALHNANLQIESLQGFSLLAPPLMKISSSKLLKILTKINSLFRYSFLKYCSAVLFIRSQKKSKNIAGK